MDHRPLAPAPTSAPNCLRIEPLDNFGRFSDYLSAASRRLLATQGRDVIVAQYRLPGWEQWLPMPTEPGLHWSAKLRPERRHLTCVYLGFVVTGPIKAYHLAHLAGRLNQAVQAGILTYGTLVQPGAMELAHGRVQVGLHTYEDLPLRYALFVYAYTADPAHALAALDWTFDEGGLPVDFPEHLYATPLRSDREPSAPAPRGYWRRHATRAVWFGVWLASWLYSGWHLASLADLLLGR